MQRKSINGLTLFFDAEDQDAAELISRACKKSTGLLQGCLGLDTPKNCQVYVMTSWPSFMFWSAPWPWKVLLAVTLPLWACRARKIWPLAGGWMLRYGQRRAVGVKPPRLLQIADKRIGDRIFVREEDLGRKVQSITCHELTHAFTSHLRLPIWLNEGLAMVMVDRFFDKPTVLSETIEVLGRWSGKRSPGGRQKLRVGDEDALVYLYVRGYWLTRYIEETQSELLRDLLSLRFPHKELEGKIAAAFGKELEEFWDEINGTLVSHFKQQGEAE
jgi:hypothetical protein